MDLCSFSFVLIDLENPGSLPVKEVSVSLPAHEPVRREIREKN
jgi:hypothetical protein